MRTKLNEISTYTLEIAILLSIVFLKLGVEKKTAQHIVFADGAALQQENIAVTRRAGDNALIDLNWLEGINEVSEGNDVLVVVKRF